MKRHLYLLPLLVASVAAAQVPSGPGDYPQWRGTHRDGISDDKGLLKQWPAGGPPIAWQIDDVGIGYSSVSIKDGILVTMGDLNGVEHIIALNADDGSRRWAVQPSPVAEALSKRVDDEFAKIDTDANGVIDEIEALNRFGTEFFQYDGGESAVSRKDRAQKLFAAFDSDSDGTLTFEEAGGQLRDSFSRMDSSQDSGQQEIAETRSDALFEQFDADDDGKISRQESGDGYLRAIFSRADSRTGGSRRGDGTLTREEIITYFTRREAGKDGVLTRDEFLSTYPSHSGNGDGILTRDELRGLFGGYRNGQGDGPRGTPTIDDNRIYAEGASGDVACLDLETGRTLWHINLVDDLGGSTPTWGFSESPLVVDNWVIVTPGGEQGTVAALDKFTGDVVWQSTENTERAHYASAVVATIGGIPQIVQFARDSAFGLALDDGKLLWKYSSANNSTANCCTPIVDRDHVFVASAYGTGGGLAKITTAGAAQSAEEVYFEKKMAIHHGGTVKIGDHMYSCGGGTLICIDFLTGDIAWQARSVGKGSVAAADGMLYVMSERQELALVEATPDGYRESGRLEWQGFGRPSWAHPVITGGKLYVRDQQMLTAYDVKK